MMKTRRLMCFAAACVLGVCGLGALSACDEESQALDLSKGQESEIIAAFYDCEYNYNAETGAKIRALDEIEVEYCFGEYNGAYVVCMGTGFLTVLCEEVVDGITFTYPYPTYIYVYDGEDFCTMQEAVDGGLLSHSDIVKVYELFLENKICI